MGTNGSSAGQSRVVDVSDDAIPNSKDAIVSLIAALVTPDIRPTVHRAMLAYRDLVRADENAQLMARIAELEDAKPADRETDAILCDPDALREIADSIDDIRHGRYVSSEQMRRECGLDAEPTDTSPTLASLGFKEYRRGGGVLWARQHEGEWQCLVPAKGNDYGAYVLEDYDPLKAGYTRVAKPADTDTDDTHTAWNIWNVWSSINGTTGHPTCD